MFPRGFLGSHGDYCNYNASGVVLHVGGNYSQNQNHGAFYLNGNNAATNANANIGCRLLRTSCVSFASPHAARLNHSAVLRLRSGPACAGLRFGWGRGTQYGMAYRFTSPSDRFPRFEIDG